MSAIDMECRPVWSDRGRVMAAMCGFFFFVTHFGDFGQTVGDAIASRNNGCARRDGSRQLRPIFSESGLCPQRRIWKSHRPAAPEEMPAAWKHGIRKPAGFGSSAMV